VGGEVGGGVRSLGGEWAIRLSYGRAGILEASRMSADESHEESSRLKGRSEGSGADAQVLASHSSPLSAVTRTAGEACRALIPSSLSGALEW